MSKNLASTFIIKLIIAFSNLAIVIVLSREIGAEGKGEASLILATIAMLLLFCNIVGGASLPYFVPRYNTLLLFLLSNAWTIIVCAFAGLILFLGYLIPEQYIFHIVILSLISSFLATNQSILLGKERVMAFNYVSLLQVVLNLFFLFILLKFNAKDVWAYVWSYYVALIICFVISLILIFKDLTKTEFLNIGETLKEMFKIGFNNQLAHVFKYGSGRMGFYLIVYYSGNSSLGVFSNAVALVESVLIISNSYATILYPKVINSTNMAETQRLTMLMFKQSFYLCLIALFVLIIIPSEFWVILFGKEFYGVQKIIVLLAPGILFYNAALIFGHYFSGVGKVWVNTVANFLGLAIAGIVSLLVIPYYTATNAAWVVTISNCGIAIFSTLYFVKKSRINAMEFIPKKPILIHFIRFLKIYLCRSKIRNEPMNKITKFFKAIFLIIKQPVLLNKVLDDSINQRKELQKKFNLASGLKVVDILELVPNFKEDVFPYASLEGGSTPLDLALLNALAKKVPNCEYLEIGTWRGESVANVSRFAHSCTTINLPDEQMLKMGLDKKYVELHRFFSKNLKNVKHIQADSLTFDFDSLNQKFDLIFIDGDHHYKSVKSDTENAFKLLKDENSVIVWHDYGSTPSDVRWDVLNGILSGLPESERKFVYRVSNTLTAIYTKQNVKSYVQPIFETPSKVFKITVEAAV
jgi:O-antigen/teichoic acid export membrane protein